MMHNLHEIISRINILSAIKFEMSGEVVRSIDRSTLIDEFSLDHQYQNIKELVYITVRLMDSHDNSLSFLFR